MEFLLQAQTILVLLLTGFVSAIVYAVRLEAQVRSNRRDMVRLELEYKAALDRERAAAALEITRLESRLDNEVIKGMETLHADHKRLEQRHSDRSSELFAAITGVRAEVTKIAVSVATLAGSLHLGESSVVKG